MSRQMDAGMLANQVLHVARQTARTELELPDAVISAFGQCTSGLTEYERDRVAVMLNFLLARVVF